MIKLRRMNISVFVLCMSLFVSMGASDKRVYAQSGGLLNLDGTGDRAEAITTIFPAASNMQSFTVEAWIYPTEGITQFIVTDDAYDLLVRYDSGGANNGLGIAIRVWNNEGRGKAFTWFQYITLNQWNHVVGMFNAEGLPNPQLTIAINGKISRTSEFVYSSFFTDPGKSLRLVACQGKLMETSGAT